MKKHWLLLSVLMIVFSACEKDSVSDTIYLDRPIEVEASKGKFGNKIVISWIDIPNVKSYQVYKFDKNLKDYTLITKTEGTSYIDTSEFQPLTKYYYKIKSYNSQNAYSSFSDVAYGYVTGKTYDLDKQFGSEGYDDGQFKFPEHLTIDSENNIYVSDSNLDRIQKFTNNGDFSEVFYYTPSPRGCLFLNDGRIILARSEDNKISILNSNKEIIKEWGEFGTDDGQFYYFRQICIDDEQNLYVVDHNNDRIQKFDLEGNFKLKWGTSAESSGNGTFKYPWGITYFKNYILVSSQNMVQFFNKNGEFIKQVDLGRRCYDITHDDAHIYIACGSCIIKTDESAEVLEKIGEGDFALASGVAVDSEGKVYAVDVYNRKVSVYIKN